MMKILILSMLLLMSTATAETDCLTHALAADEPVILIGNHPLFYGSLDSGNNHYMNYEIIDNQTIRIYSEGYGCSCMMSMRCWDEIRPDVYYDGVSYFKLFIDREPQRYWKRMI